MSDAARHANDPIAVAWDRHASDYDRLFAPLTGYVGSAMVALLQSRMPSGAAVIDIGCGTGGLALAAGRVLAQKGSGTVLGTDLSAAMIARARAAARASGLARLVAFQQHDGQALGLADAQFDLAFSAFGIFLFPDRMAGWREAARVLKPGGSFATAVWQLPEHNELARLQVETLMQTLPERVTQSMAPPDWRTLMTAEGLRDEVCAAAPFNDARIVPFKASAVVPSPLDMWQAMEGNPVTARLLDACTEDELPQVRRAATDRFADFAGGRDRPLVLETACNILIARRT